MFTIPIILCIIYLAYQVFLLLYDKYEETQKLDEEYSELVEARDCSVCLYPHTPQKGDYCGMCNLYGHQKMNFRPIQFESFKNLKKREIEEDG